MRQNALRPGLHPAPRTPLGELTALPRPSSWIWRKEWEIEGKGRGGKERGGRGGWKGKEIEGRNSNSPETKILATALLYANFYVSRFGVAILAQF